ncbi:MAG: hemopexin repeat-containing protein [Bacteroidia bacterium]
MPLKIITLASNPFNETGIDDTVHAAYMDCFKAITKDSNIHIAMYMWHLAHEPAINTSPLKLTNKLIEKVKEHDVNCEVLFDTDYYSKTQADDLKAYLENGTAGKLTAEYSQFKEFGSKLEVDPENPGVPKEPKDYIKLHNKTMLFSKLDFSNRTDSLDTAVSLKIPLVLKSLFGKVIEYVVVESSANIWKTQYSQANQINIFYGDEGFYQYALDRFTELKSDIQNTSLSAFTKYEPSDDISNNVKSYALPRSGNIIESFLKNMINDDQGEKSSIHIAMADFSNTEVASKLITLHNKSNFDVKLINRDGESFNANIKSAFKKEGLDLTVLEKNQNGLTIKVHSKYLLFDGHYNLGDGQGIKRHKIIFAGCTNYTKYALEYNSETLYRIADDKQYAILLKNWQGLRYTNSLQKISAAVGIPTTDAVYFFHGTKYVKWIPEKGIDTVETNKALRTIGATGWQELPQSFQSNLDASLWYEGHVYFFKGNQYCKYRIETGIVKPEIRTIGVDGWKGIPQVFTSDIDAALKHPTNGHLYFFKGNKYCKWKPDVGFVEPAIRTLGVNGWKLPPAFLSGVDAALTHPTNNSVYFFKGNKYCKWTSDDNLDSQQEREIGVDGWEGIMF